MADPRNRVQRFLHVPDTWEGWALRVMTVAIALVFVAISVLLGRIGSLEVKLIDLETYIEQSRTERNAFQQENVARQCRTMQELGLSLEELRGLRC